MHRNRYLAHTALTRQQALELHIVVAIEGHAWTQVARHLLWEEAVALGTIDAETLKVVLLINEAQSVAIGKGSRTSHVERVATHLLDSAHKLAHRLRRIR